MHKTFIAAFCTIMVTSAHAQVTCHIKGEVAKGHPAKRAVIGYEDDKKYKTDTVNIAGGRFEFTSSARRPALAQITLLVPSPPGERRRGNPEENEDQSSLKNMALFYLEKSIGVKFDTAGTATVTGGGKEQQAYDAFVAFGRENEQKGEKALPFDKMVTAFIQQHPDAYISLDLMEMFAGVIQPATFEPMYLALSPRLQDTDKARSWKAALEKAKKFDVGQQSIDFTLNDVQNVPVSLSSFKGRYVLLDFWASWCGPCRAGHPELIDTYNKFRSDKFEILAVSLDNNRGAWLKAIAEDKLPWKLVRDMTGIVEVAKMYNVTQIPQNLLIGPDGVIIGRNLTGKNLVDKLSEVLN